MKHVFKRHGWIKHFLNKFTSTGEIFNWFLIAAVDVNLKHRQVSDKTQIFLRFKNV